MGEPIVRKKRHENKRTVRFGFLVRAK